MISDEKKTQWGQKYFFQNGIVCKYVYDIILNVFWSCFTVIAEADTIHSKEAGLVIYINQKAKVSTCTF